MDLDGSILRSPPPAPSSAARAGAARWMSPLMARFLAETAALQPAAAGGVGVGGVGSPLRVIVEVDQSLYADGTLHLPQKLCLA